MRIPRACVAGLKVGGGHQMSLIWNEKRGFQDCKQNGLATYFVDYPWEKSMAFLIKTIKTIGFGIAG